MHGNWIGRSGMLVSPTVTVATPNVPSAIWPRIAFMLKWLAAGRRLALVGEDTPQEEVPAKEPIRSTAREFSVHIRYFGDSYDIVKQSMLCWLDSFGEWSVHPMFTEAVSEADVKAFGLMLGAKVISSGVFTTRSDRAAYLACAAGCGHLFLDPDTGLRLHPIRGVNAPKYLFAGELVGLAKGRPNSLTVVFDQSVARGSEKAHLNRKLEVLEQQGLFGFGYVSHACFLVVGPDQPLIKEALVQVIRKSRLPTIRFLSSFASDIA